MPRVRRAEALESAWGKIELAKSTRGAYLMNIDIWPDHVAVPPSLIARRTFRPPKIDEQARARQWRGGEALTALIK